MPKMKRKTKKAMKQALLIPIMLSIVFVVVSFLAMHQSNERSEPILLSEEVENHQQTVEKYAKQYGVSEYVDVILAMMMQESSGRGKDPMQASESYCGERHCIQDPELSIRQGVKYFSQNLQEADGDIELAVQAYNFGKGFIDYVKKETGSYSQDIAIDFSQQMYQNAPNKSIYTCLREEAKQYNACYGDIYYVRDVMAYKDVIASRVNN
ncbi:lysozyme family protein [Oceanobacillus halotolerans]|uniref:lysozyme family protein n=1 Tax=Oceanobacillus halotolerans TaxID=2663380 RepID=UPI00299F3726|nr:lysozyme family protein [Oceanobacillus halotolerans]